MISLLFDGERIADHQTAEDLELEDGDVIEVLLEREWLRMDGTTNDTRDRWLSVTSLHFLFVLYIDAKLVSHNAQGVTRCGVCHCSSCKRDPRTSQASRDMRKRSAHACW